MHLLAVETSGASGGIALLDASDGPTLVEEVLLVEGLRHARDLLVAIKGACERAGWRPRGLDTVAVSIGPGSFTGLRIAVTLAKFIAWDSGARVVAVPSLRAMAENAPADCPRVACIRDAKRRGLYASVFERSEGGLDETFGPALIQPDELARRLEKPALVVGRGVAKAAEALAAFELAPETLWDVRPAAVARLGYAMWERGELADPLRLEPVYIRRPEAEEIWQRRHGR
ncbi:MAG TPA: tRNA (adenosine(37)-N6)-threonylcarbamoyltransferase complex dimerization subunit type 1 TsaB [Phycisphaerae bacterium]|nr:tRNA (adenosine(37)-N6)-threonylcarbamoyltransferase complex dimerization subunit type 1 TsaB [Phycisphaerae bacterium]